MIMRLVKPVVVAGLAAFGLFVAKEAVALEIENEVMKRAEAKAGERVRNVKREFVICLSWQTLLLLFGVALSWAFASKIAFWICFGIVSFYSFFIVPAKNWDLIISLFRKRSLFAVIRLEVEKSLNEEIGNMGGFKQALISLTANLDDISRKAAKKIYPFVYYELLVLILVLIIYSVVFKYIAINELLGVVGG